MSAEAITDALAAQFATVSGIKAAYASGAGGQPTVGTLPLDIFDTPIAVVYWQGMSLEPGPQERVLHLIDADVYFSETDPAIAYKTYLPFVTAVIVSMRTNSTLGGTCTFAQIKTCDPPTPVVVSTKPYVRLTFKVEAVERTSVPYT
jgi:hypothetical protein